MSVMEKMIWFSRKYRMAVSRIFAVLLLSVFLFSAHSWGRDSAVDLIFEVSGLFLIGVSAFGRLWTSMYICGYKTDSLVTKGPYSTVRNPLYFFSFIGAVGIGLSSENLLGLALIIIMFTAYYPFVILAEEKKLMGIHKNDFLEYMKKTPRFFPKLSLLHEPAFYKVNISMYRKSFFNAIWFIWVFIILQVIEMLHYNELLPVLFRIP